jgi:carbonic anhydrase
MFDIIYRFDPERPGRQHPESAREARERLEEGNLDYASILAGVTSESPSGSRVIYFDLEDIGACATGNVPRQQPYAVVLGCSDARVPVELLFNRAANELFVVRVAGNVLGQEQLGSIDYAVQNLGKSLKLLVVLGHSQCGAVSAAVDAFLKPANYLAFAQDHQQRVIINSLFPAVRGAVTTLAQAHGPDCDKLLGYRSALIELSVILNAGLMASILHHEFAAQSEHALAVAFGVYDLKTRRVHVPLAGQLGAEPVVQLVEPPHDLKGFVSLCDQVARSGSITHRLFEKPP